MIAPVPILLYHSVSDDPPSGAARYAVGRRQFAAHLDQMTALGFLTLTVGELLLARESGMVLPERTVAITFDDGFADFAANAWSELVARDLTATLYVTAGRLDRTSRWLGGPVAGKLPMLTRNQVVDLAAAGCEIGAHSMTHPRLDLLPRSAAAREVTQSKAVLEHLLGRSVDTFAYPYGSYDPGIRQLVVDAGFHSAAAVRNAFSPAGDDWFALGRMTVTADLDVERLIHILTEPCSVGRPKEPWPNRLWRQARRFPARRSDGKAVA